jgi:hypothetical protein
MQGGNLMLNTIIGKLITKLIEQKRYPRDILAEMLYLTERDLLLVEQGKQSLSIGQFIEVLEHLGYFKKPYITRLETDYKK